jgi:hypothetical protein
MRYRFLVALWLFLLLPVCGAQAAERFVDGQIGPSSCSNYNPATRICSEGSNLAYKTLPAGNATMVNGDTLHIRSGTYDVTPQLLVARNNITFAGYQSEKPVIQKTTAGDSILEIQSNDSIFRNFIVDGIYVSCIPMRVGGPASTGLGLRNLFEDIEIRQSTHNGFNDVGRFNVYQRMWVHDFTAGGCGNDPNNASGSYLQGDTATVEDSLFERIQGLGMTARHGTRTIVQRNIFRDMLHQGMSVSCGQFGDESAGYNWGGTCGGHLIYNNLSYNNGWHGYEVYQAQNVRLFNNLAYNNGLNGLNNGVCGSNSPGIVEARNNIFYNNGAGATCGPNISGTPNLTGTAPSGFFASAPMGDFHLTASATAAIDQGANLSGTFTTDKEGKPRPEPGGSAWDIGPYECQNPQAANCGGTPPQHNPIGLALEHKYEGNFLDTSGSDHHGMPQGDAAIGAPIIGTGALALDGNGDFVQVTGTPTLQPVGQEGFGILAWVNATTVPSVRAVIFTNGDAISFYILPNGNLGCLFYTGSSFVEAIASVNVLTGTNRHVACSYQSGDGIRIWLDNGQVAFTAASGAISFSIVPDVYIGRRGANAEAYFAGRIDNQRYYDAPLTPEGIANDFNQALQAQVGENLR